ncbi:MAG: DUF3575 domain-containing protein [Muribaculaceae bacterium]|nr:DUF3575 domain-containing protein [Muribaculaceae bacterium]
MRTFLKTLSFIVLAGLCFHEVEAKTYKRDFHIDYRLDSINIDRQYMDNDEVLTEFRDFLRYLQNTREIEIDSIAFEGTASPDGYIERNQWLSRNRLEMFKKWMREELDFPDSLIVKTDSYIPWLRFEEGVEASDIPSREEVLEVLRMPADTVRWYRGMHTDSRLLRLRSMQNGRVWETLKPILAENRFAQASLIYHLDFAEPTIDGLTRVGSLPLSAAPAFIYIPEIETWVRRLYIKTNLIDWALLIANIAVEIDLGRHWSFTLPVFYSKWDYFVQKIRFRVAGFQPELRYWFNPRENDGWFVGAHFGFSYYNMGFNGAHRYQDYEGKTPTMGGGVAFGWRKQFGSRRQWCLEFTAGGGVYPLKYDVFENTEDYRDGKYLETRKKTFYGLDQAAVTIGYTFDIYRHIKVKGGGKR